MRRRLATHEAFALDDATGRIVPVVWQRFAVWITDEHDIDNEGANADLHD
jgi:hypothetical protein